jgi:hypothetical protein
MAEELTGEGSGVERRGGSFPRPESGEERRQELTGRALAVLFTALNPIVLKQ